MFNKREKDFRRHMQTLFNTESGRKVLAYLKEDFLAQSPIGDSPEKTYYIVGQQDIIRTMISCLENQSALDNLETVQDMEMNYE